MKFSVVNIGTNTGASGATLAITVGAAGVPAGATIFVLVTEKSTSGTSGTLADTAANSYSTITSGNLAALAADGRATLFAVTNCKALVNTNTITYTRNLSAASCAMSAFYVSGATGAATFTEGVATATGTTGAITVTSGSLGVGRLVLGALFASGTTTAGGSATFTQATGGWATPPVQATTGGSGGSRSAGGTLFKAASGTQVYNPTLSSTAQQWFLAVVGIIPAPETIQDIAVDLTATDAARNYPTTLRSFTQNLLQSTLTPTVAPTVTYILRDPLYTNPRGYEYSVQLRSWSQSLQTTTLPPPPPVAPYTVRAPLYTNARGPDYHVQLRSWIGLRPPLVGRPFAQYDWPLSFAPARAENLKSWSWQYNVNLIGQDQLPAGEIITDLVPGQRRPEPKQLHSWLWSYNLNLIGKDRLTIGKIIYDLTPRPYDYHAQLRTWLWSYNLNLIGQDQFPPGEIVYELAPRAPGQPAYSWTWNYNQNLIGKDQLPVGEIVTDTPAQPSYHIQLRTWIGAAPPTVVQNPFAQYDWPNPRGVVFAINLGSITASYNLNLIGQDQLPVGEQITDALPQRAPQQPERTITAAYNPNLVGKDRLPFRQQDWPNPQPVRWYQNWAVWQLGELELELPFKQSDWPLPRGAEPDARRTWTWNYNINLIGQDQLPVGEVVSDLPPRAPLSAVQLQTWIQSVNLALTTVTGNQFSQSDWPTPLGPQQPQRGWTQSFNLDLIGQDRLPNRQQDWPLTPAAERSIQLRTWIDQTKLLLAVPFKQTDWPNPRAPQQPAQSFTASYNQNLIGKDQLPTGEVVTHLPPQPARRQVDQNNWINIVSLALVTTPAARPFNQFDWPNPKAPQQAALGFTASYNGNLIGKDQLPFRQSDWPNPIPRYRAPELSSWIDRTKWILLRPTAQLDWPNPRAPLQPALGFTASYNLNLIGKDRLPVGRAISDLPPQPTRRQVDLANWINTASLALTVRPAVPFHQTDSRRRPERGPFQPNRSFNFWGGALYLPAPTPVDTTHILRAPYYSNPRGYEYPPQLRELFGRMPPPAPPPPVIAPGIGTLIGAYPKWRLLSGRPTGTQTIVSAYVNEDGVTVYVAEDGSSVYIPE